MSPLRRPRRTTAPPPRRLGRSLAGGALTLVLLGAAGTVDAAAASAATGPATVRVATPAAGGAAPTTRSAAAGTTNPDSPAAASSATTPVVLAASRLRSVQRRIGVRADGTLGARTRAALRRYQRRRGLTVTGRPDAETLRALGLRVPAPAAGRSAAPASSTTPAASTTPTAPSTTPVAGSLAVVLATARAQVGVPYVSGGETPAGFDCSGLVVYAFGAAGVGLPRTSFEQFAVGVDVPPGAVQSGDLVFFASDGPGASHVGIATGPSTAISATTHGVMEHQIADDYWGPRYVGARRVVSGS